MMMLLYLDSRPNGFITTTLLPLEGHRHYYSHKAQKKHLGTESFVVVKIP